MISTKRIISMKVLPGEPLDGSGKVCIHLFVPDKLGEFVEPCALYMAVDDKGGKKLGSRPTRGRLACNRRLTVAPVTSGRVTTITLRTDDPRAVTCQKCCTSAVYVEMMDQINVSG